MEQPLASRRQSGYSSSTVALDVKTGQIKWAYQNTPNDAWDFDGANEFVTFDMDGKRYGGKADRNGFFYVIDANTGKLQNAFPFVKKITWASSIDLKTGRPNFIPAGRPGDPTKGEEGKKWPTVCCTRFPRCKKPDADGVLAANQAVLCAGE